MFGRSHLKAVAVAVLVLCATSPVRSQAPRAGTGCSSNSSIRTRAAKSTPANADGKAYSLDEVRFDGDTKLTRAELDEAAQDILREARDLSPDRYDTLADVGRTPWQDRGYFRVGITSTVEQLSHDPTSEHFGIVLHVNAGRIFHAGEIRLTNYRSDEPTVFPIEELGSLLPIRHGDVFDTSKLREGFDALKKRYRKSGYIDATILPEFDIDEDAGVINLTLRFDEEKQFTIASVKVLGLDSSLQQELRSVAPVGEPFNYDRFVEFLDANKSRLPDGAGPDNLDVARDFAHGKVYVTFDFRSCQQASN
jgi:outer membrane protein assembly factor BamA